MKNTFALVILIALISCNHKKKAVLTGLEGKELPDFSLLLADSVSKFNTRSIPPDQPAVFMLFSPYCPYCRAQIKEITKDIKKVEDIQFYFATRYSLAELRQFSKENNLDKYSNITAGVDISDFMTPYFKATGIPFMAIYGRNKKLNKAFVGRVFTNQIQTVANE